MALAEGGYQHLLGLQGAQAEGDRPNPRPWLDSLAWDSLVESQWRWWLPRLINLSVLIFMIYDFVHWWLTDEPARSLYNAIGQLIVGAHAFFTLAWGRWSYAPHATELRLAAHAALESPTARRDRLIPDDDEQPAGEPNWVQLRAQIRVQNRVAVGLPVLEVAAVMATFACYFASMADPRIEGASGWFSAILGNFVEMVIPCLIHVHVAWSMRYISAVVKYVADEVRTADTHVRLQYQFRNDNLLYSASEWAGNAERCVSPLLIAATVSSLSVAVLLSIDVYTNGGVNTWLNNTFTIPLLIVGTLVAHRAALIAGASALVHNALDVAAWVVFGAKTAEDNAARAALAERLARLLKTRGVAFYLGGSLPITFSSFANGLGTLVTILLTIVRSQQQAPSDGSPGANNATALYTPGM